jgi:hypothetical protein
MNYVTMTLITILTITVLLVLNKEKFVMDINGKIPDNLFIEKRIPKNDIPTIEISLPANRIYNPVPYEIKFS